MLTGSRDGHARLWDISTGKQIGPDLVHHGNVFALAFSPDGRTAATAGLDAVVRLWDASTGRALRSLVGHTSIVYNVTFRSDGRVIATTGADGSARLWDAATAQPIGPRLLHPHDKVESAVFSGDGTDLLTTCGDGVARLWPLGLISRQGRRAHGPLWHRDRPSFGRVRIRPSARPLSLESASQAIPRAQGNPQPVP